MGFLDTLGDIGDFLVEKVTGEPEEETLAKNQYKELEGDARQSALRFQEQCYLMLNWESIVASNRGFLNAPKRYKQFGIIEHQRPFELINLLFKKSDKAELLLGMSSAQISALVPKVRLYKEYKDPTTGKSVSIELPFDDIAREDKIANIMNTGAGRGGGVGLKSFTWKTLGTNPANKFTFGAELVLHLQNIEDLFETRDTKLVKFGAKESVVDIAYSDLILTQKKFRSGFNEGSFTYDKDYFRIKAVVGWHAPALRSGTYKRLIPQELLEEIEKNNIVMYLGLKNHEIDFQDDGTVELKINYISYSEIMMSDPQGANILFESAAAITEKRKLAKILAHFEALSAKERTRLEDAGVNVGELGEDDLLTISDKQVEELSTKLEELVSISKEASYKRIISGLYEKKQLRYLRAPKDFFDKKIRIKTTASRGKLAVGDIERANREAQETRMRNETTNPDGARNLLTGAGAIGASVSYAEYLNSNENNASLTADERLIASTAAIKNISEFTEEGQAYDKDSYLVTFFYLGDLIDIVLEGMFDKPGAGQNTGFLEKELRIITGPLTFYDYGQLVDTGLVAKIKGLRNDKYSYDKVYRGKRVSVNIADIPISFKIFTNWFYENIADKGLENMTFKKFMDSVINDLVIRALSTECTEFAPKQQARITYKSFSVPENDVREAAFDSQNSQGGVRMDAIEFAKFPFILKKNKLSQDKQLQNYLIIYGTMENPFDLVGDPGADSKNGIYHVFFGNERGLTKNIKFKREDLPFIREANIQSNLVDKMGPAKVLRDRYNADLNMVGNNLFEVGGKVHITPTVFVEKGSKGSLVARSKILRDLGIGGYFDIISIESSIESGIYGTNLETRWTARGDGTFNVGDEEVSLINTSEVRHKKSVTITNNVRIINGN